MLKIIIFNVAPKSCQSYFWCQYLSKTALSGFTGKQPNFDQVKRRSFPQWIKIDSNFDSRNKTLILFLSNIASIQFSES